MIQSNRCAWGISLGLLFLLGIQSPQSVFAQESFTQIDFADIDFKDAELSEEETTGGFVHLSDAELLSALPEPPAHWPGKPPVIPSGASYTLKELEDLALSSNPTLQQAAAEVMRLEGICLQVGLKPNPIFGYQASEVGNEGSAGQQGVFIGQEFVRGDKLGLNRSVASNAVAQARWNRETQQQRVLNTVRWRFYETLGATSTGKLAEELQALAEQSARISTRLKDAGEGTQLQVLQAQIEAKNNNVLLKNTRIRRRASLKRLAAAIGTPSLQPEHLAGNLDQSPPDLEFDAVWEWLLEQSPELQASYYAVHRARWAIKRAEAEPIPNMDAQIGLARDFSTDDVIVNLQIGFPIPYNNKNQGNITAAQAEHIRASREIERLRLDLRDRLVTAFQSYETAKNQAESYRDEILPLAKRNLDLNRQGYEQAELNYLQLLTAQRTYFQRSIEAINAQTTLWLSVVRIQGLVISQGLSAPGEISETIEPPDVNTTYPLGLFPMQSP